MKITCEISVGELLDKISILLIKKQQIKDAKKLEAIQTELDALLPMARQLDGAAEWMTRLQSINQDLWDIEDDIRDKERDKDFGQGFIDLARSVYLMNDKRFAVKADINKHYGSNIQEQKSYKPYKRPEDDYCTS